MNKKRLRAVMMLNGDTYQSLAEYLGMAYATLCKKINEYNNSCFTQEEIYKIKEKYNLSQEILFAIFFDKKVS